MCDRQWTTWENMSCLEAGFFWAKPNLQQSRAPVLLDTHTRKQSCHYRYGNDKCVCILWMEQGKTGAAGWEARMGHRLLGCGLVWKRDILTPPRSTSLQQPGISTFYIFRITINSQGRAIHSREGRRCLTTRLSPLLWSLKQHNKTAHCPGSWMSPSLPRWLEHGREMKQRRLIWNASDFSCSPSTSTDLLGEPALIPVTSTPLFALSSFLNSEGAGTLRFDL